MTRSPSISSQINSLQPHGRPSLSILPPEILLEIFFLLDLRALSALRLTCKNCFFVSTEKSVWVRLYHRYTSVVSPDKPRILDRPFSSYLPHELEEMVFKMVALEANWTSDHPAPRNTREIDLPSDLVVLLPGGRWLLSSSGEPLHRIICYDLSQPSRPPYTLIKPYPSHPRYAFHIAHSVDGDADGLQGNIAVMYYRDPRKPAGKWPRSLGIWEFRYNKAEDRLFASLKKLIPTHGTDVGPLMTCLRGDKFLRGRYVSADDRAVLEVLSWLESDHTTHKKSTVPLDFDPSVERTTTVRLLTDEQLIVMKLGVIQLYDIPEPQTGSAAKMGAYSTLAPRWTYNYTSPVDQVNLAFSPVPPFSRRRTYPMLISVYNSETVYTIAVPDRRTDDPITVSTCAVGELKGSKIMYIGSRRGFWCDTETFDVQKTLGLISFWPSEDFRSLGIGSDQMPQPKTQVTTESFFADSDRGPPMPWLWRFDEQSGTIIKRLGGPGHVYKILSFA